MLRALSALPLIFSLAFGPAALAQDDWDSVRKIAEAQYEIIKMMIEKGQFEKVPSAAAKVFELDFPSSKEHLLVDAASYWTDLLLHHKQPAMAHEILGSAYQSVKLDKSKAALCLERAYVYKMEGNLEAAQKMFEKSVEHESKAP